MYSSYPLEDTLLAMPKNCIVYGKHCGPHYRGGKQHQKHWGILLCMYTIFPPYSIIILKIHVVRLECLWDGELV